MSASDRSTWEALRDQILGNRVSAANYAAAQLQSAAKGSAAPVALLWMALDESGGLIEAIVGAPDWLGYRGIVVAAMGGGHVPERLVGPLLRLSAVLPTVVSPRAGGGPLLRQTYGGPSAETSRWR
jgi:L-asparaginase